MEGLGDRIARVYEAHPEGARARTTQRGAPQARGVIWFAERIHRHPTTVSRWISGVHPPDPLAIEVLARLEREAGTNSRTREE